MARPLSRLAAIGAMAWLSGAMACTPDAPAPVPDDAAPTWALERVVPVPGSAPVTLHVDGSLAGASAERVVEGTVRLALDADGPEARTLTLRAPERYERWRFDGDAWYVTADGAERLLIRRDEVPPFERADELGGAVLHRRASMDGDCMTLTSTWSTTTAAPAPWNEIAWDETRTWCPPGVEVSRTLQSRSGDGVRNARWVRVDGAAAP